MRKYIFKLCAPCKNYIWGGNRLRKEFGKKSDFDRIAESWELSCHKDGQSVIENGELKGRTLFSILNENKDELLGENCKRFKDFPILIKLIDAQDNLSVQVHPSDTYARANEGENGKTEMWYIVDCDEGAEILYGFKHNITKEEFKERIANNTLVEITNSVPAHKGDVFFIEAGTLHAIGKGIIIAEIQQSSNITYRIYDYGRVDNDGKPRPLNIEKALEVTELTPPKYLIKPMGEEKHLDGYKITLLSKCDYFDVHRLTIETKAELEATKASFNSVVVLDGNVRLDGRKLKKGDSCFIPAGYGKYRIVGKAEIILTDII